MDSGDTIGPYRVVEKLGQGGMGEVYRARDSKLDRDVALKILPASFAGDPDRLMRFTREAKTLAALSHPNIAAIHGLEEAGDVRALVMELVEGEDLSQRIARGPILLDDALPIARQIANALEAAHEQGVIHRDLKPANIKVRADGTVKVLDFGLAKAMDHGPAPDADVAGSPTMTSPALTTMGVILGTAAYMSPEQARGRPVDRRADLWAFGCVLYEMLTGSRSFGGETTTDIIASVVQRDPDWSLLPTNTPAEVRRLLRRLLAKAPTERLRDAGDAALLLRESDAADAPPEAPRSAARWRVVPWLVAATAVVVAIASVLPRAGRDDTGGALRLSVALPAGLGVPTISYNTSNSLAGVALSPDASQLTFVAHDGSQAHLYLRRLDQFDSTRLPGTLNAIAPFFSPDGRQLGFFSGNGLWRLELPGGLPVMITPASFFAEGGTWSDADDIIFTPSYADPLWTVPAAGGQARELTRLDAGAGEASHRWPHALPGGRAVLFVIKTATMETLDEGRIAVADVATGQHRVLLDGGTRPHYLDSGHIVFARDRRLYAVPFDLDAQAVRGAPVPVIEGIGTAPATGNAFFSLDRRGSLAYIPGGRLVVEQQVYRLSTTADPEVQSLPRRENNLADLAPDGRRLLLGVPAANDKLWIGDLAAGNLTRLTSGKGNDRPGQWSPDGRWVIFASDRDGGYMRMYRMPLDGSQPARPLLDTPDAAWSYPWRISRQARLLGYEAWSETTGFDGYVLPIAPDGSPAGPPALVAGGPDEQTQVAPAPDGNLVAYTSTESGEPAVYVMSIRTGQRVRVTNMVGGSASWSTDGRRLHLVANRKVYAVPVLDADALTFGEPARFRGVLDYLGYVVAADGHSVLAAGTEDYFGLRGEIRLDLGWWQQLAANIGTRQ